MVIEMNKDPARPFSGEIPPLPSHIEAGTLLPGAFETATRFNLARQPYEETFIRDVITPEPHGDFSRFLVMEEGVVDDEMYKVLKRAHIPQLPRLGAESLQGQTPEHTAVFGVYPGLKPLAHERMYDSPSSASYIGDIEIMRNVGRMYSRIWRATGRMPISAEYPDSPLDHVALASFSDHLSYLYLCPPYVDSPIVTGDQAYDLFKDSIANAFPMSEHGRHLHKAAVQGFEGSV